MQQPARPGPGGARSKYNTGAISECYSQTADPRAAVMTKGRQADSARRRQRVAAAISKAAAGGAEISVSSIARAAAVDRTFLYRHRDLLGKIHALEAAPPAAGEGPGPAVTRASLQADLLAAHERAARLNACVQQLERRLSERSASRPGANPGSARPPTSTPSPRRSPASNSRPSTCGSRQKNATRNSPQPGQPTASSWPSSTPLHAGTDASAPPAARPGTGARPLFHHTCCAPTGH